MKRVDSRLRAAMVFSAAAMLIAIPVSADQIVHLVNGTVVKAKSVVKGDTLTTIEFEGGARVGIPTAQIKSIQDFGALGSSIDQSPTGTSGVPALVALPGAITPSIFPAASQPPPAAAAPTAAVSGAPRDSSLPGAVTQAAGVPGTRPFAAGPTRGSGRAGRRLRANPGQPAPSGPAALEMPAPEAKAEGASDAPAGTVAPE